ncbi:DUF1097 domain-containing protein [Texcoconibacillus texcoconensis]|uniref:DUF1097 domain-containing protein n=1 Tax=Texcoconibacillus texcoconensis TaxID=1095777 RepID=A0A840QL16_9BACI|nr:DUF1097 domain-containing protein [Texcoconibacillus texcoconensis]MBB5171961.1 hypothetical protein [Texcoconibacillus texcoconensis]
MGLVLATGLLCGIWTFIAPLVGMFSWAGFAGCTTFFSIGTGGGRAMGKAMLCNTTGVACGMMILGLAATVNIPNEVAVFSGVVTCLMCLLGKVWPIDYTPGIFMGCFTTFAANGQWVVLTVSLLSGAVLGFLCAELGKKFSSWYQKVVPENVAGVTHEEWKSSIKK